MIKSVPASLKLLLSAIALFVFMFLSASAKGVEKNGLQLDQVISLTK